MKDRTSLINWGLILALLIGAGILTILWPALFGNLANSATQPIPSGPETIVIPLPIAIAGQTELVLTSWQLMGIIAFLVIGAVITGGIVLAILNWILSRIIHSTQNDPEYQQDVVALNANTTAEIKEMQAARPTHTIPDSAWSKWAVIATSLAVLMFVFFFALLIANTLFPEGIVVWQDTLVNITAIITIVMLVIALVVLILANRSRKASPAVAGGVDTYAIPWDTIAVLVSGLLVVGIGIGVLLLLNSPS